MKKITITVEIETEEQRARDREEALASLAAAIAKSNRRRTATRELAIAAIQPLSRAIASGGGQGRRIAAMVWSLWNGVNKVGLCDVLCGLDAELQDALLAIIRDRMARSGDADEVLRVILQDSGAMAAHLNTPL